MSECKDCKVFDQGEPCYGGSGEGRCKQLVPKWVDDLIPTEYEPDIVGIHRPADDCPCFSTKDEPTPESVLRALRDDFRLSLAWAIDDGGIKIGKPSADFAYVAKRDPSVKSAIRRWLREIDLVLEGK